jgi:hypothetical protein
MQPTCNRQKNNALPKHHLKRADDPREFDFTHSIIVTGKDQGGDLGKYAFYFDIKTRIIQEFV